MKKILCLLLALVCMLACVSCIAGGNNDGNDNADDNKAPATVETIAKIINSSKPTQITTKVEYIEEGEETLVSSYNTEWDEAKGIYAFTFTRREKAFIEEYLPDDVKVTSGTVWYNADGTVTSSTGDSWSKENAVGYLPEMLNISTASFKTYELTSDGADLKGTVAKDDAKRVFGEDINAFSDITVEIDTNGKYLYKVVVEYTTAEGATVKASTSYDYAAVSIVIE